MLLTFQVCLPPCSVGPSAAIPLGLTVMFGLVGTEQVQQPLSAVVQCILAMVV